MTTRDTAENTHARLAMSAKQLEERLSGVEEGPDLNKSNAELRAELRLGGGLQEATAALVPALVHCFTRFVTRCHKEKIDLGKYVAENVIVPGFRGFIQASTVTIPIAERLATLRSRRTCIYTNSVVLPICALREDCEHEIQAFSGPIFDEFCGGWLIPVDDGPGHTRFRGLFKGAQPLTSAILAPMAIKPDSGPYFVRQEMAHIALAALKGAKETILIAPASRVYLHGRHLEDRAPWNRTCDSSDWKKLRRRVTLIVAGTPQKSVTSIASAVQSLEREFGFKRVIWQDPISGEWPDGPSPSSGLATDSQPPNCTNDWMAKELMARLTAKQTEEFKKLVDEPDDFLDWIFWCSVSVFNRQHSIKDARTHIEELMRGIFEINRVLSAYESASPDQKSAVSSAKAAFVLGVSRTALLKKCAEKYKLFAKDFKAQGVTVGGLVMKSTPLQEHALELWLSTRRERRDVAPTSKRSR